VYVPVTYYYGPTQVHKTEMIINIYLHQYNDPVEAKQVANPVYVITRERADADIAKNLKRWHDIILYLSSYCSFRRCDVFRMRVCSKC
jgi:hypothetical protein